MFGSKNQGLFQEIFWLENFFCLGIRFRSKDLTGACSIKKVVFNKFMAPLINFGQVGG